VPPQPASEVDAELRALIEEGERVSFFALVLCEWLRGPPHADEVCVQEALFAVRAAASWTWPSPHPPSCTTPLSGR